MIIDIVIGMTIILVLCAGFSLQTAIYARRMRNNDFIELEALRRRVAIYETAQVTLVSPSGILMSMDVFEAARRYSEYRSVWIHGPLQLIIKSPYGHGFNQMEKLTAQMETSGDRERAANADIRRWWKMRGSVKHRHRNVRVKK